MRGYIATGDATFLDPLNTGEQQYTNYIQKLKVDLATNGYSVTSTALSQLENSVNEWATTYREPQIANMHADRLDAARAETINNQGKRLFDAVRNNINRLQLSADRDLLTAQSNTNTLNLSIIVFALILTVLVVTWLAFTFSLFTRVQREQMDSLKAASAAFGEGDLTVRVSEGADTEFNELGRTFNTMVARLRTQQRALKDRDILENVLQLNSLMTESLDLQTLIQNTQQHLLNLLDVQVSAFYRFDAQTQTLNLFSAVGSNNAELLTSIALGEGLIGRAAKGRKPLMISNHDQEDQTFQVQTIMGTVLPSSLYHLPLLQGKELLGVFVLGSIYPMSEQARNVLNVISSNLAAAVHNAASYERIQNQALELAEYAHQQEQSNKALVQKHEEMTVLNAALVEANRVRSQFLSTMSHELRTPLTSIIGFAQMVLRSANKNPLNERQTSNIDRILKNSQHLLSLINDVLDLAKIEAGRMDINADEIILQNLISSVVEETRSMAIEKRLNLTSQFEEGLGGIETDPRKLRQILLNLISNALKFTEKGAVEVSAKHYSQATEELDEIEQIIITIRDTGIGIPLEKQEHIFEAFYQADNSNSRNYGGTGLGLSIVHELTTLIGGKLEFQSVPGTGSTFSIILPVHLRDQRFAQNMRLNSIQPPRRKSSTNRI
ncbi:hypothetical protein KSX_45160 [Ktedonospora formicarum]|uniref:Circadian input-output histidine kinase CikA n=1 Tax=Ktedonospora formicarum TaxID=2778364 RepID=A0A8J3I5N6_9CHLR|nr:hypothetical protein KSX_45160 [Ktedonospora formicarum]